MKGPWGGASNPRPHQKMTDTGLPSLAFWQAQPLGRGTADENIHRGLTPGAVQQGAEASTVPGVGWGGVGCAISLSPGRGDIPVPLSPS